MTHIDAHGVMVGEERINAATVLWSAGVAASRFRRSSGSVFDARTLKCQSG